MNKKHITVLFIISILLSSVRLQAQVFTNYTVNDGLPSDNVTGVAVDQNGSVWFATEAGVARFSNSVWTVYTTADGLVANYINCIAVDAQNRIWVGTDVGANSFDGSSWSSYSTATGLVSDVISYIAGCPNGDVWIGTNNGISRHTSSGWITYTDANGLPGNMISYIRSDLAGTVWIGTWLTGLAKFDGTSFTLFSTAQHLLDNNILSLAIDKHGNKWIGTYMGITVLDSLDQWKINYTKNDGLYLNYVQDIAFDSHQIPWAGIYADYLMDGAINCLFQNNWYSFGLPQGLVNVQVKRIAIDPSDNVWIATGAGVSKLYVNNLGISATQSPEITIYPNPARNILYFNHPEKVNNIYIYDLSGRMIRQYCLSDGARSLDISGLSRGVYFLKTNESEKISPLPFFKQ